MRIYTSIYISQLYPICLSCCIQLCRGNMWLPNSIGYSTFIDHLKTTNKSYSDQTRFLSLTCVNKNWVASTQKEFRSQRRNKLLGHTDAKKKIGLQRLKKLLGRFDPQNLGKKFDLIFLGRHFSRLYPIFLGRNRCVFLGSLWPNSSNSVVYGNNIEFDASDEIRRVDLTL